MKKKEINHNEVIMRIIEHQKELMKKYGYYVHFVEINDEYVDYHTHGLTESYNIPELQIVLPIRQQEASLIFESVIYAIRHNVGGIVCGTGSNGNFYLMDPYLLKLINGGRLVIKLIFVKDSKVHRSNDKILRIILSDKDLKFKSDFRCDPICAGQEDVNIDELTKDE